LSVFANHARPSDRFGGMAGLPVADRLSVLWKKFADGRVAIRHRGPRDVAGWSMVGGEVVGLALASIGGACCPASAVP
jgi:hypothetical protein